MANFTTITGPERPECYDRLSQLSPEAWGALRQLYYVDHEPTIIEPVVAELEAMGLMREGRITEEGRLAYGCQLDFPGEGWDYSKDGKTWMSCAVIATDGNGNDVLLHAFGPAIDWHIDQVGDDPVDLGLDGHPEAGVWVWEGSMGAVRCFSLDYGEDWDHEATGDFRAPTEEEWARIKEGECPWDRENLPKWPSAHGPTVRTSGGSSGSGPTA